MEKELSNTQKKEIDKFLKENNKYCEACNKNMFWHDYLVHVITTEHVQNYYKSKNNIN